MKLTEEQKSNIRDLYEGLKNDDQTLGELCEIIVNHCVDELLIVDLSDDENGNMYDVFYEDVWDFIESIK